MKRFYAALSVLALSLTVGVTAMAQGKMAGKAVQRAGCSSCDKQCATPEQFRKFKADSIDLRQEMMNKRFDLQREYLKEIPDSARVAAIKADIEAVKVKIDALKTAAKLSDCSGRCLENCALMDCGDCSCTGGMAAGKGCGCGKDCKCGPDCSCASCKKAQKGAKKSTAGCANCNKNKGRQQ